MRLYLVRHGEVVVSDNGGDVTLSEWGKFEVEKSGTEIADRIDKLDLIFHSNKLRAQQTAKIIQAKLKFDATVPVNEMEGLKPNDSAKEIAEWAGQLQNDIMLVGHLPFMNKLAGILLKESEKNYSLSFGTASVAGFERGESGDWMLLWFFNPPKL